MEIADLLDDIKNELKTVVRSSQKILDSVANIATELEISDQDVSLNKSRTKSAPKRKKIIIKNERETIVRTVPSTRIVQDIIWKSSHGVDTKTLMDKTGYDQRKIYNIVFQLKNKGKVKSTRRGVYEKI